MNHNTHESLEHESNPQQLLNLLAADARIKETLLETLQPVIDDARSYMAREDGTSRKDQKKFSLKALYESFGIPSVFTERRNSSRATLEMEVLQRAMREIFDANQLEMVYGYGNIVDNDYFTLQIPERHRGLAQIEGIAQKTKDAPALVHIFNGGEKPE